MKFKLVERISEAEGIVNTFVWEPEEPVEWVAGQYIKYNLPHDNPDDRGTTRWFTIAAPPYEQKPRITTRFTLNDGSSFKAKLRTLGPGDTIEAGKPSGDFTFDVSRPAILIAGGIGITPYRAMLLQLDHDNADFKAHMLYANRNDQFVFRDQIDAVAKKQQNLTVDYFTDPRHIDIDDIKFAAEHFKDPLYYISGPEPMVNSFKDLLVASGVKEEDLKLDDFPNYDWPMK
ncbi:MAG TPA: FAD-dependent oxidoreductase [Candidatus Saccharimonadales bacterium]|nr:FAD-dependent oxidoreductase [Candidatus Saccharimonadales bacterium]